MSLMSLCGCVILCVTLLITLKQLNSNYALPLTVIFCLLLTKEALQSTLNELDFFQTVFKNAFAEESGNIILKTFGISFAVEATSDVCRDAGENALASKLETLGKIEILIVTIPLIKKILEIISEMML